MLSFGDDDDVLDGVPLPEDEEPTRTVRGGSPPGRRKPEPSVDLPTVEAVPAVKRWLGGASVHSLVGSEEALRVFDELSNPGGTIATFAGTPTDEPRAETITPGGDVGMVGEGVTQELSFTEPLESVPGGPPPIPGVPVAGPPADAGAHLDAYLVFEHTPCPLFQLDELGRIRLANVALCRFLSLDREEVIGKALHKTRLGQIFPDLGVELDEALNARSMMQQVVSYQDAQGNSVRFLIWIVPFPRSSGRASSFAGIILPYPG